MNFNSSSNKTLRNFNIYPSSSSQKQKFNIIFQTVEGEKKVMNFPKGTTVHQAFKQYLIVIKKYNKFSPKQKNNIVFRYNTKRLFYSDERKIETIFHFSGSIIQVTFPKKYIDNNNTNRNIGQLNKIEVSNCSRNINNNFNINDYQTENSNQLLIKERSRNRQLQIENDNLRKQLSLFNNQQNKYLMTDPNEQYITVNFESRNKEICNYRLKCKKSDLFVELEKRLYKDFPYFKNIHPNFFINSRNIERFETIENNKINNNDIILIYY